MRAGFSVRAFGLKRPRGQSLVLACLVVLVLAVAVVTTVLAGHTVHERIRLQNTADAAAYSAAALEARAFNFYAFANRAQASHYVSAMVWQSFDSFLYFSEAFLTDAYGVAKTLSVCSNGGAAAELLCVLAQGIPYLGPVLESMALVVRLVGFAAAALQQLLTTFDPDRAIGRDIIPFHRTLNQALAESSSLIMTSMFEEVRSGASRTILRNDPNLDLETSGVVTSAVNACLYDRAHFREANGSPLAPRPDALAPLDVTAREERSKVSRAKRAMGAVANATRYGCDSEDGHGTCAPGFVTNRRSLQGVPLPEPMKAAFDFTQKLGQTRLLTFGSADGQTVNRIRQNQGEGGTQVNQAPDRPYGPLAQGDVLASDDLYRLPDALRLFLCDGDDRSQCPGEAKGDVFLGMKTSIWAMSGQDAAPGGIHWRLVHEPAAEGGPLEPAGLRRIEGCRACVPGVAVYAANVQAVRDGNHPWEGVVPFSHFEPGAFAQACGESPGRGGEPSLEVAALMAQEFNQPSTWVFLNKDPRRLRNPLEDSSATRAGPALLNDEGTLRFRFKDGSVLKLENDKRALTVFAAGLNVLARGQAYYHRPGAWNEPPNFFNPYWRPRLASVLQGRSTFPLVDSLVHDLPPPFHDRPQKLLTH